MTPEFDKQGRKNFIAPTGAPAYNKGGSMLSAKNRRAFTNRLGRRWYKGEVTDTHASMLHINILAGTATRQQIYGFHPTKNRG